jgi:hypothetical protein
MGGRLFPEMRCTICADPVDLNIDLCTDETGAAVHEGCYVERITALRPSQHCVERLLEMLSAQPASLYCVKCQAPLLHVNATFSMESGESWMIPLPVCKNCNRLEVQGTYAA